MHGAKKNCNDLNSVVAVGVRLGRSCQDLPESPSFFFARFRHSEAQPAAGVRLCPSHGHEGRHPYGNIGFTRLAIFAPASLVGNAHTPAWVGGWATRAWGRLANIDQRILGRSIAAEIASHSRETGEVTREQCST